MPVLKHAKKKLRQDKKRALKNKTLRESYKRAIKTAKAQPNEKNISAAFSQIDKAAKHNILHENKAARLKAALSKISAKPSPKTAETKAPAKAAVKKPATKAKSSTKKAKTSK